MTNVYAVAIPLLLFASAYVGYAGLQTQANQTPRIVRDKVDILQLSSHYRIPDPFVEPLKPKGIRVSIPDESGMELFGFHGSLNKPIVGFQSGPLHGDVTRAVNGRWTFVDRNLKTNPGDVLHFWVFVQNNGLGYRKDNYKFKVKDTKEATLGPKKTKPATLARPPPTVSMVPTNTDDGIEVTKGSKKIKRTFETQPTSTLSMVSTTTDGKIDLKEVTLDPIKVQPTFAVRPPPTVSVVPAFDGDFQELSLNQVNTKPAIISRPPPTVSLATEINNSIEENSITKVEFQKVQAQLNETLALLSMLNEKIDPLNRELKLLREIVADLARSSPGNTKLILRYNGGSIPGNPLEFVRSIVVERLELTDLYNKILAANQIVGGIVFDVSSMYEKNLILARAKDALRTSKYKIEEFSMEIPQLNSNCIRIIDEIQFPTTAESKPDQPTTFGGDRETTFGGQPGATGTTLGREPDQPTDILPTDSLDSLEDDISKKIDIRMASDEAVRTTLSL